MGRYVSIIVLAVGIVQLFAGALDAGVTTDEPIHVERAEGWVQDGWYVPEDLLLDGRPDPGSPFSGPFVYGPAYAALAHFGNVLLGNEALDEISRSAAAYDVRHLTVALIALLAVGAVAAAVWRLTGSRQAGLWAAAGLLAVPAWTGHAFFNPKDIPVASGYTLVTVGLLFALGGAGAERAGRRERLAIGALLAAGVFIAAGTRMALWVPFLGSLLLYAALRLGQHRLEGIVREPGADWAVAIGAAAGFAAIAVFYPEAAATPIDLLRESVSGATEFPYQGFTLTAGELLSEHPPWWYLPAWVGASYPLLLGALAVLGGALGVRMLVGSLRETRGRGAFWSRPELRLLLVLQQALFLPFVAVVNNATLYNGMRQHLYVLPALAILAGVGALRFWEWARSRRPERRWRRIAAAVLAAALLIPMAEQTLLFPYNYAYVNPIAGIAGVEDEWETDYWFAAGPEALSRVPAGAELLCSRFMVLPWDADGRPELEPCDEEQLAPFADRQGTEVAQRWRDDELAVWVIGRKRAGNRPPDYCEEADDVTRWLRGEEVTMAFVLRCDPEEAARDSAG